MKLLNTNSLKSSLKIKYPVKLLKTNSPKSSHLKQFSPKVPPKISCPVKLLKTDSRKSSPKINYSGSYFKPIPPKNLANQFRELVLSNFTV
jgi:hypothetical protein